MLRFLISTIPLISAQDPSSGWLSYSKFSASPNSTITQMNATWVVPGSPSLSGDPFSIWFGLQTATGDGALVQPVLAWEQTGSGYSIFQEVFDWTTKQDTRSKHHIQLEAGDTISASVTYRQSDNSYDMWMTSERTQRVVELTYALQEGQKASESSAYIVIEHQPRLCVQLPPDNVVTFSNIYIEVDGQTVKSPTWIPGEVKPMCQSKAVIINSTTVQLTWVSGS